MNNSEKIKNIIVMLSSIVVSVIILYLVIVDINIKNAFKSETNNVDYTNIVHNILLKHPEYLKEMVNELQAQAKDQQTIQDTAIINSKPNDIFGKNLPFIGNPNGKKVVAEFFDYQCPYCHQQESLLENAVKSNPDLKIIFINYPILGPESEKAGYAAFIAGKEGKYNEMHNILLTTPPDHMQDSDIISSEKATGLDLQKFAVDFNNKDYQNEYSMQTNDVLKLGKELGLDGTPSFVAVGAGTHIGYFSSENQFEDYVDQIN
jgi:protein-disulfide isomerase